MQLIIRQQREGNHVTNAALNTPQFAGESRLHTSAAGAAHFSA